MDGMAFVYSEIHLIMNSHNLCEAFNVKNSYSFSFGNQIRNSFFSLVVPECENFLKTLSLILFHYFFPPSVYVLRSAFNPLIMHSFSDER